MTLPLFAYQKAGAEFLATHDRVGLFDEMGVGKTAQAIGALDKLGAKRALVVCPAAAREVWFGEFRKFQNLPRRVMKGKDIQHLNLWLRGLVDVLVISYEMAVNWRTRLVGDLIEVLILDEAHYCKSSTALRTRALLGTQCDGKSGIGQWASKVWFLTGSPMSNSPQDIWPFLRFTEGTTLTKRLFLDRYFLARQGQYSTSYTPRPQMVDELRQAIVSKSLKRTKAQAGLELPPIWLTTQSVEGDTSEIKQLLRQHPGLDGEILRSVEAGGLSFLDAAHIGTLRRLVGEAKAPAFAQLIAEELHGGLEKICIFGIHVKALKIVRDTLTAKGFKCVQIDGSTSEVGRRTAVNDFQNDPKTRIFIGNIRAAGVAITLHAAADVVLMEASWAPNDNVQALMRVHRIGQKKEVRARFFSLANSIDEKVTETLTRKTAAIAKVEGVDTAKGKVLNV